MQCAKLRKKLLIMTKAAEAERKRARSQNRSNEDEVAELKRLVETLSAEIKAQARGVQTATRQPAGKLRLPAAGSAPNSARSGASARKSGRGQTGRGSARGAGDIVDEAPDEPKPAPVPAAVEVAEEEEEDVSAAEQMLRRRHAGQY